MYNNSVYVSYLSGLILKCLYTCIVLLLLWEDALPTDYFAKAVNFLILSSLRFYLTYFDNKTPDKY